jgi:TonB-dependent receptor-like protein
MLALLTLLTAPYAASQEPSAPPAPPAQLLSGDSLSSGVTYTGKVLRHLPVDDVRQALAFAPGVVFRGFSLGVPLAGAGLSVRGSPAGDVAVYVDGAPARFELFGIQALSLATEALENVTLTTGVAGVGLPDARGGVIEYTTRGGDSTFAASLAAHTDEPFGSGSSVGFNRFAAAAGGPLGSAWTWFASGTLLGQRGQYLGRGAADLLVFAPGGPDTTVGAATLPRFVPLTGLVRPENWSTQLEWQAKLRYAYGRSSTLSLSAVGSDAQARFFPAQAIGDSNLYRGQRFQSRLVVADWRHTLRGGEVENGGLQLRVTLSLGIDRQVGGLLEPTSELATRDPALGVELSSLQFVGTDSIPNPLPEEILRNIRNNSGLRTPFLNQISLRNAQPYRTNPYGLATGWPTLGQDGTLSEARERRWNGRAALAWVHGPHAVTVGADVTRNDVRSYTSGLLDEFNLDALLARPRRYGAFAADRLALGRLTLEAGARFDHLSPGADLPDTPGRIFTNPAWNPAAGTDDTAYAASLARVSTPARGHAFFLPRVRAALRAGPGTLIRAGYGAVVEPPTWQQLLIRGNSDLANTSTAQPFGRDVDYAKSAMIDAGLRQSAGASWDVELAAYYKTHFAPYTFRFQPYDDPANPGNTLIVNSLWTIGGDAKGLEASLDWYGGPVLSGRAAYSLVHTHLPEVLFAAPSDITQHQVTLLGSLRPPFAWRWARDAEALLTVRLTDGLPYNQGGDRFPWTKTVDLRLSRPVRAGGIAWTLYADARNLFNTHNQTGGYSSNGKDEEPGVRAAVLGPEVTSLAVEAQAQPSSMLNADGSINLGDCTQWSSSAAATVDCVALQRVEQRFGDGDHLYTVAEQDRALNAYFDAYFGAWRFHGPARTIRLGLEVAF